MARWRAAALLLGLTAAGFSSAASLPTAPSGGPDSLVVAAAQWLAAAAAAYLWCCAAVAVGWQLVATARDRPGPRDPDTPTTVPRWLRPGLAFALGATVVTGIAPAATADDRPGRAPKAIVSLGWPVTIHPADAVVIVDPGDSLWSIAADALGAAASPVTVAREWPRWWQTNRAAIGAHPDLIQPGQRLVAPPRNDPTDARSPR